MMTVLRARVLTPRSADEVTWLEDAAIHIDPAGTITAVEPYGGQPVDEHLQTGVLTPGFVDAHVHYPQTRIVGAASGPLLDWLATSTFPEEARFSAPDHADEVARTFTAALAAAGTTLAMVYGPVFPAATEALFAAAERRGLRVIAGPVLMDEHCPPGLQLPAADALDALDALGARWHGRDDRLFVAAIPRFALCCSAGLMRGAADLARRHGWWVSTHLAESLEEGRITRERFAAEDYLRVYEDAGLVHRRSVFAHAIHLSDAEWDRIAAAGAVIAHCPDSNFFLGSGRFDAATALARGVPVALGTDVAAGRSFRVPRIASSAYDSALARGTILTPSQLWWWATRGGALALGQDRLGAVEPGMEADLVWHDLPAWVDDPIRALAWLVFDADAPRPRKVWVRGKIVWDRGPGGGYPWDTEDR
ncbi:MAG: guanine deaminase [Deltaproteobacteria bacterium]|nr:guanine deaminase [Deltaproteobacteria bacterium]